MSTAPRYTSTAASTCDALLREREAALLAVWRDRALCFVARSLVYVKYTSRPRASPDARSRQTAGQSGRATRIRLVIEFR